MKNTSSAGRIHRVAQLAALSAALLLPLRSQLLLPLRPPLLAHRLASEAGTVSESDRRIVAMSSNGSYRLSWPHLVERLRQPVDIVSLRRVHKPANATVCAGLNLFVRPKSRKAPTRRMRAVETKSTRVRIRVEHASLVHLRRPGLAHPLQEHLPVDAIRVEPRRVSGGKSGQNSITGTRRVQAPAAAARWRECACG